MLQPQEETGELLVVTLLGMVTRFCNSSPAHFPIRKLLLLLWKLLLVTLGGTDTLRILKGRLTIGVNFVQELTPVVRINLIL